MRVTDTKLRRYLVFAYMQYYPGGGMNDCVGEADTEEEAMAQARIAHSDDVEILDRLSGNVLQLTPEERA